jgi:hypothetical protein
MSLEATHLRFALAIREDLGAGDMEKYVSGTIYPDTRYLTGIHRHLTHDFGRFLGRKQPDDFEKGWIAHLLGDRIFKEVTEERFPDLVLEEYDQRWAVITAIKIIQDLKDAASFDLQEILPHLDYYELHFREDERRVIQFNELIRKTYEGKERIEVEDCHDMWEGLGMNGREIASVKKRLRELYADGELVERIRENFGEGMDLYRRKYRALVRERDFASFVKAEN